MAWPVPSPSAETFLMRREGAEALLLTDLRRRPGVALRLRVPFVEADASSVAGEIPTLQRDYDGVEVLAVHLPIPDSPWIMVAKVDASEALAPWRLRAKMVIALWAGLVALVLSGGMVARQRNRLIHQREMLAAEVARSLSESRHRTTLRSIGDAVIVTDARGSIELMNPVAEALTGWSEADALGKNLDDVFHIFDEETGSALESPAPRVLREGRVIGQASHTVLRDRGGVPHPIAHSGAPIHDAQGAITGAVLVFRDQSTERRVLEALKGSEERFRSLAENAPAVIYRAALDETATAIDVSPHIQAWGYSPEEWLADPLLWVNSIHPEDRERVLRDSLNTPGGPEPRTLEYRLRTRSGEWKHVRDELRLVRDDEGRPVWLQGIMIDVTAQKAAGLAVEAAQARLEQSERYYRALTERSSDAVAVLDVQGIIRYQSPAAATITGYEIDELVGMPALAHIHEDDMAGSQARLARLMENPGAADRMTQRLRRKDGRVIWIDAAACNLSHDPAIGGIVVNYRDVTERVVAESALRRANRALRTIGECLQTLGRAAGEEEMFQETCRLLVDTGGYRMVWIGVAENDDARSVRPIAWAGFVDGDLDTVACSWGDNQHGRGPTGTAVRERRPVVASSLEIAPDYEPWRQTALLRGYRSSIALPLLIEDVGCLGALSLYASEPDAFGEEEVAVLVDLGAVLSQHVRAFRDRKARVEAEAVTLASERRYRVLFETMAQGVVYQDADGRIVSANPAAERILGLSLDQMQGRTSMDPRWQAIREDGSVFPGPEHPAMEALRTGRPVHGVSMGIFHPETQSYRWILVDAVPEFRQWESRPFQVYATFTDITDHKRAEEALRDSEEKYRRLFEAESDAILLIENESGRILEANSAACLLYGYSRDDPFE